MIYLLIFMVMSWVAVYFLNKQCEHSGDDFGAAFPTLVMFVIAVISTLAYLALVFWNHRFW